jgi:hypothetical protein
MAISSPIIIKKLVDGMTAAFHSGMATGGPTMLTGLSTISFKQTLQTLGSMLFKKNGIMSFGVFAAGIGLWGGSRMLTTVLNEAHIRTVQKFT